jgi:hypothetical protein
MFTEKVHKIPFLVFLSRASDIQTQSEGLLCHTPQHHNLEIQSLPVEVLSDFSAGSTAVHIASRCRKINRPRRPIGL